jgi:hypothetical protein
VKSEKKKEVDRELNELVDTRNHNRITDAELERISEERERFKQELQAEEYERRVRSRALLMLI